MLDPKFSRARQRRLLAVMQQRRLDAVVVGLPHHVYYFGAVLPHWLQSGAFVLLADGRAWLTTGNAPAENAAVDEAVSFEASWMSTLRQEQPAVVAGQVMELLRSRGAKRVGIDASPVGAHVAIMAKDCQVESIDEALWQMRRVKDADELALMEKAVVCAAVMYRRAREIIEPGITETEVFVEVQAAAIREAGEPMTALMGNDFVSGRGGGPPRKDRKAEAGEIFILDVGPCYRGYFADCCRGFAVGGKPTDAQLAAAEAIVASLKIVEARAKPGVRCRDIYEEVNDHLLKHPAARFGHHLGHGVGLQPHEFPHLNPKWDEVLMEGEVFTAEPGLYAPHLRGGLRIENEYVVTKTGVRNLLDFPMELT
jgi:Xaa-Pro aminopeptidase